VLGNPQIILQYWATKLLTLVSFIKQSTQQRGGKGRAKKENPKSKPKAQKPKVGGSQRAKEQQIMFQSPHQSISKREMKFERVGSLEEPSLARGNAPQNRNKQVLRLKFSF
jgi:hypothetical protein